MPIISPSPHIGVHTEGLFWQVYPKSTLHKLHPSLSTILLSSHSSFGVRTPFPQISSKQESEQPSPLIRFESSHSSPGFTTPFGQGLKHTSFYTMYGSEQAEQIPRRAV